MVLLVMSSERHFEPGCERIRVSLVLLIMIVAVVTVIMIRVTNVQLASNFAGALCDMKQEWDQQFAPGDACDTQGSMEACLKFHFEVNGTRAV